jgi:predicted metal-dependent peptidase
MPDTLSSRDFFELRHELEGAHSIFAALWDIGKPTFTNQIPTAAIAFNREGEYLEFLFNKEFWDKCDNYKRQFVICHEALHVILDHGKRSKDADKFRANLSLDVVVNHMLVDKFGFERELIEGHEELCWVDKTCPGEPIGENFEYYYNRIGENAQGVLLDDHSLLEEISKNYGKIFKDMGDELDGFTRIEANELLDEIEDPNQQAGTEGGTRYQKVTLGFVPKKKKWETVIKDWVRAQDLVVDQWAKRARRIANLPSDMFLPSEDDYEKLNKIRLWAVADTSGSCVSYCERFFKAMMSIPEDRFDIKYWCFDVRMYPTTKDGKLYGFGGTCFRCINDAVNKAPTHEKPDAIWVLSDGYGSQYQPEKASAWTWFLTPYNTKSYIAPGSTIYDLADYE